MTQFDRAEEIEFYKIQEEEYLDGRSVESLECDEWVGLMDIRDLWSLPKLSIRDNFTFLKEIRKRRLSFLEKKGSQVNQILKKWNWYLGSIIQIYYKKDQSEIEEINFLQEKMKINQLKIYATNFNVLRIFGGTIE